MKLKLLLASLLLFGVGAFAQPANDMCVGSETIALDQTISFDNSLATDDQYFNACGGGAVPIAGVWYTFTAPSTSAFEVSTCGSFFNTLLLVFEAPNCGSIGAFFAETTCNDDFAGCASNGLNSVAAFDGTIGNTYFILVASADDTKGSGSVVVTDYSPPPVPSNNLCANAVVITQDNTEEFYNDQTTTESQRTTCDSTAVFKDVWYVFSCDTTGEYSVNTCGSVFNTKMAVYEAADCAAIADLSDIACNDNDFEACDGNFLASQVVFSATEGNIYYIRVGSADSAEVGYGNVTITRIVHSPASENDNCASAIEIFKDIELNYETSDSNSTEMFVTQCDSDFVYKDIWYVFNCDSSSNYQVSTCGSEFDTKIAVYEVASCGDITDLTDIACNDDHVGQCTDGSNVTSALSFDGVTGTTYYVRVGGYDSTEVGVGAILIEAIEAVVAPANDDCVNAEVITVGSEGNCVMTNGTNVGATDQGPTFDPIPLCDNEGNQHASVWYRVSNGNGTQLNFEFTSLSGEFYSIEFFLDCGARDTIMYPSCLLTDTSIDTLITGFQQNTDYFVRVSNFIGVDQQGPFSLCFTQSTVSVSELAEQMKAIIYPNPSNGNIAIKFEDAKNRTLKLVDVTGKEIMVAAVSSASHKIKLANKVASGVYMLHITDENGANAVKRVIVE